MKNKIEEFHTKDTTWSVWKANSHEEFMEKFGVKPNFHNSVPDKIKKEFVVVERLICYSYYHYPLIDEAFSKLTRLFESALTFRLEELGIKTKSLNLNNKIKRFEQHTSTELSKEYHKARFMRNKFAHQTAGVYYGVLIFRQFIQMLNVINTIFLDKVYIESTEFELKQLIEHSNHFKSELCKLEFNDKKYLIWSTQPCSLILGKPFKSFWVCHPVLTHFPQNLDELNLYMPICLSLKNVTVRENEIIAESIEDSKRIKITKTNHELNIKAYEKHKSLVLSSDISVKEHYWSLLETEINQKIVGFRYKYAWNN